MESGLGIFSLNSTLTDLAEPSESLKATTAWQVGLENPIHLLSALQIDDFRKGAEISNEIDVRGFRGAYLLGASIDLDKNEALDWHIVLDVNQDSADISRCLNLLKLPADQIVANLESDIASGTKKLNAIIASADGLQL